MKAFEKHKIRRAEKVLKLLKEGRDTEVLFEFKRNKTLNRLQKFNLIEVVDGKFQVTEKGQLADQIGVENYLETLEIKREIAEFSLEKSAQRGTVIWWGFLILLVTLLAFLGFSLSI